MGVEQKLGDMGIVTTKLEELVNWSRTNAMWRNPSEYAGERSTTVPSESITKDCPSNTSSSWPPSRLQ